jgi:hypothetical protein
LGISILTLLNLRLILHFSNTDLMTLDLHGKRHHEVPLLVENFIYLNQDQVPLTIICGNSQRMIDLVQAKIYDIDCKNVVMDRYGIIVVREI